MCFNPRSPRGERREAHAGIVVGWVFQSTLPSRGATPRNAARKPAVSFQSTLPSRGATCPIPGHYLSRPRFNPRSPRGERPPGRPSSPPSAGFQSTLPSLGATVTARRSAFLVKGSVHAPLADRDRHIYYAISLDTLNVLQASAVTPDFGSYVPDVSGILPHLRCEPIGSFVLSLGSQYEILIE